MATTYSNVFKIKGEGNTHYNNGPLTNYNTMYDPQLQPVLSPEEYNTILEKLNELGKE